MVCEASGGSRKLLHFYDSSTSVQKWMLLLWFSKSKSFPITCSKFNFKKAFDIEKKDQFDVSLKRGEQKRVLNLTKEKKLQFNLFKIQYNFG